MVCLPTDWLDPESTRGSHNIEMAFRMQASVPELTDFRREPSSVLDMYGAKSPGDGCFASNCLLARRLAERGVRFIQLYHRAWDHHGDIQKCDADRRARRSIRPVRPGDGPQSARACSTTRWSFGAASSAARRWGRGAAAIITSFGFSIWLAGGGIKAGSTYGATDELGYRAVENVLHLRDLHATILHLCGIDHTRLGYKFQGWDVRLTGVEPARVVSELLA